MQTRLNSIEGDMNIMLSHYLTHLYTLHNKSNNNNINITYKII